MTSSQNIALGVGVKVLTVSAGLNLQVGQTIVLAGLGDARMSGTVVSYDNATGALVINVTSSIEGGSQPNWTVFASATGTFYTETTQTRISDDPASSSNVKRTDQNGNIYFDGGLLTTLNPALSPPFAGETFELTVQTSAGQFITYTGTVKLYQFSPNGTSDFQWYAPQLAADMAANRFGYSLDATAPNLVYFSFGATRPVTSSASQIQTIGTGTKVLTVPTAQSYVAGEAITLTDSSATGNSMTGSIVSYSPTTGALVLNITSDTGAGNTASGNWTFGISLPQSVVNTFLANDYFTPNSLNAAHQTFYGFVNGNTTTPGTLMGFVQNPFGGNDAAALSGLAGGMIQIGQNGTPVSLNAASALHVSPEIDLVNPSTSINNGDISVLTNWNLGAGVAGSDGNPASLYFRYQGWAPNLTLRAVHNLNLNASITDGFFQKVATVGGIVPGVGINLNGLTSSSDYLAALGFNDTIATFDFGDLVPSFPQLNLQPPAVFQGTDQYYTYYGQYVAEWNNYYNNALQFLSFGLNASVADGGLPEPQSLIDELAAANAIYSHTNPSSYPAYLAAYDVYVQDFMNSFPAPFSFIPVAPLPPPAISTPVAPVVAPLVNNGPAPIRTVTDQSPIAGMSLTSEVSSSAYRFVAGAQFSTSAMAAVVNPDAVAPAASLGNGGGDITLSGHISYNNIAISNSAVNSSGGSVTYNPRIDVPTIIRTGTGSIDMVASEDIEWLDPLSPAAVYTAGTVAPNAANFTVPTLPDAAVGLTGNGLVNTPTWATAGGALTLSAGRDIIGIETPVDSELIATVKGTAGAQTLGDNSPTMAQFWSAWYIPLGQTTGQVATPFSTSAGGVQNSAYINYSTFFQGVGALGGGNVTINAGRDLYDLSVSLPETIQVSGGRFAGDVAPAANYFGGGNLSATIGGNLYSSDFYVGRGTGVVRVTGSVLTDTANPIAGQATGVHEAQWAIGSGKLNATVPIALPDPNLFTPLPLLLAEQDSYITIESGGTLALGGIFQPTRLPAGNYPYFPLSYLPTSAGAGFDSFGSNSGVTLMAASGTVSIVDALPPSLSSTSLSPGLRSADNLLPPNLEAVAVAGDVSIGNAAAPEAAYYLYPSANGFLILAAGQNLSTVYNLGAGTATLATSSVNMEDASASGDVSLYSILGTPTPSVLSGSIHANDPNPVLIYAGQDIIGEFKLIKAAQVEAGRDILDTQFIGQNNRESDVTSIVAGRDIRSTDMINGVAYQFGGDTSLLELYGPGQFEVVAGRNLGSFLLHPYSDIGGGILAVGDGSNSGGSVIPYLSVAGANITTLFGVGAGVDVAAAIAAYVDPAAAHTDGINYLPDIAVQLGVSQDQAWAAFQALSPVRQKLVIERAFLDVLTQVNADYTKAASPYYHQYARAYQTIATLFPASLGYTDNNSGGGNGASAMVHTGDLRMARSRIETQTGGDINILGPGGNILVGANQADTISPNQEGILTLQGGAIRTYTDGSVQVYQSRIFTEQGGNVEMFSANGDLNAGKGPKSSAAYPPLQLSCDVDGYCRVSPAGLVTGAGVGALLSIPGQDPALSNVVLTAPHGTVDAGAAGIRVAGNLNIVALQVLNAFNIQVQGATVGLPTTQGAPVGALTAANNAAGAVQATTPAPKTDNSDRPSVIFVEFLGFGGESDGGTENAPSDNRRERRSGQDLPAYDTGSKFQVIGNGELTDAEKNKLTEKERNGL